MLDIAAHFLQERLQVEYTRDTALPDSHKIAFVSSENCQVNMQISNLTKIPQARDAPHAQYISEIVQIMELGENLEIL